MKKLLIFTLALTLALCSFADVFADSDNDNVVRLSKSEGTVVIADANGVTKNIPAGGKVLTGYSVATGKDGYAYLTQGEKKLIKLDINTVVTIKQSKNKKKIEVFLESGNVFVNASEKLGSDEQLDIKTTNTTTGLRGTMLEVSVENNEGKNALSNKQAGFDLAKIKEHASVAGGLINDKAKTAEKSVNVSTKINVIEGVVTTTTTNFVDRAGAAAQESKTITLTVGQSAEIKAEPESAGTSGEGSTNTIEVKPIEPSDLRGSTLEELKNVEPERLESLKEEVGAEAIEQEIEQAEEKMEEEQKAAEETAPAAVAVEDVTITVDTSADNMFAGSQTSDDDGPIVCTVTLDLGNGSQSDPDWEDNKQSGLLYGTEINLPASTAVTVPENYVFKGWFDNAEGTGTPITSFTTGYSNVTFYAYYAPLYTVTLNLQGGSQSDSSWTGNVQTGLEKDTVVTLPASSKIRTPGGDCVFKGWYDNAEGEGDALPADYVVPDKSSTVYAVYTYTVTLHLDGGNCSALTSENSGWSTADAGETYTKAFARGMEYTLSDPDGLPEGKDVSFVGWYTVADDTWGTTDYSTVPADNTSDIEVYAKYAGKGTVTIHAPEECTLDWAGQYDDNGGFTFNYGDEILSGTPVDGGYDVSLTYTFGESLAYPLEQLKFLDTNEDAFAVSEWLDADGNTVTGVSVTDTGKMDVYAKGAPACIVYFTLFLDDFQDYKTVPDASPWIDTGSDYKYEKIVTSGAKIELPAMTVTKDGDTWESWNEGLYYIYDNEDNEWADTNVAYHAGDSVTINNDTCRILNMRPQRSVKLYMNGGTINDTNNWDRDYNTEPYRYKQNPPAYNGSTVTLPDADSVTAPDNYVFKEWNTESDGSGDSYDSGATIAIGTRDINLYAIYSPTYTVTLYLSGGSCSALDAADSGWNTSNGAYTQVFIKGTTATLPAITSVTAPTGSIFIGWNTASDGTGTPYTDTYTGNSSEALYAIYTYTVTLHLDGGSCSALDAADSGWTYNSTTKTYSKACVIGTNALSNLTPTVSGTNTGFSGWFTISNNTWGTNYSSLYQTNISDIELYARYIGTGTITLRSSNSSQYYLDSSITSFTVDCGNQTLSGTYSNGIITLNYDYGTAFTLPTNQLPYINSRGSNGTSSSSTQYITNSYALVTGWKKTSDNTTITGITFYDAGSFDLTATGFNDAYVVLTNASTVSGETLTNLQCLLIETNTGNYWFRVVPSGTQIYIPNTKLGDTVLSRTWTIKEGNNSGSTIAHDSTYTVLSNTMLKPPS